MVEPFLMKNAFFEPFFRGKKVKNVAKKQQSV